MNTLSQGQLEIWNYHELNKNSIAYNVPMAYYIEGSVNLDLLLKAIDKSIEKHPIFKTRFYRDENNEVKQKVDSEIKIKVLSEEVDIPASLLKEKLKNLGEKSFSLEKGGLARFNLFKCSDGKIILFINIHHIIFDGLSISIILSEIKENYLALLENKILKDDKEYNYTAFLEDESRLIENDKEAYDYWNKELKEEVEELFLQRKAINKFTEYKSGVAVKELSSDLKGKIDKLAHRCFVSNYALLLSVYNVLMAKHEGNKKIVTLSPFMNRMKNEFAEAVGYFVNMIPIKVDFNLEESFSSFAERVQEKIYETLQYAYYPLQQLTKKKKISRIGNAIFYYQNWIDSMARDNEDGDILKFIHIPEIFQEGEFELVFEVLELHDKYILKFRYDENKFSNSTIKSYLNQFVNIIEELLKDYEKPIENISLLGEEGKRILNRLNDTYVDYDKNSRIYDYIKNQAEINGSKIAIRCGEESITYRELDKRSDIFAKYLINEGVQSGDVIGVYMTRTINLIVSLIGIMKADAIYVPIDVMYPLERIEYMIKNSNMGFIIIEDFMKTELSKIQGKTKILNVKDAEQLLENFIEPERKNDLVYILYTSGSTGNPKGVQIYHKALVNSLLSFAKNPGFTNEDILFSVTTVCFDIAELEMFLPLISGGTLEFAKQEVLDNVNKLKEAIIKSKATVLQATPALLRSLFSDKFTENKLKVLCGGEALSFNLAQDLLKKDVELWNMYGPTETTIWSSVFKVTDADNISIGQPIANTRFYILDSEGKIAPINEEGELYIAGESVAKGYFGNEKITNERFIDNYFEENKNKMYATGDIVKLKEDGNIEYCGRKDNQVKIRGYRIELGEIEKRLNNVSEIIDSIVVVREDIKDKKMITAFIKTEDEISSEKLNEQLLKWLPRYMIPVKYVKLEVFPKTLNQKYDRKVLMKEKLDDIIKNYGQKERSEDKKMEVKNIQENLKENIIDYMCKEIDLDIEIDTNANIAEYGFDSISFTKLADYINTLGEFNIDPTLFYSYNTVNSIVKELLRKSNIKTEVKEYKDSTVLKTMKVNNNEDEIVVVGMSCRFPGSDDVDEFWDNLKEGRNLVREIPLDRWDWRLYYDESNTKLGGFINNVRSFDASFFGISPREAKLMDPQQRLILESVCSTIEDAGHKMSELKGSDMGVFIGTTGADYMALSNKIDGYTLTGIARSVTANRISYLFDWHGPSEPVDTACSSSLVAFHRAVKAIKTGECSQAIVGGVNVILSPFTSIVSNKIGMLSPDGACKTFDDSANGYVRGEGVGSVYLKKLSDAIKDKDHIYAVVKGTSENHGGRATSLTAPNKEAQSDLIVKTIKNSDVDVKNISYIETHGTGTALGDPIEINGLKAAFERLDEENNIKLEEHTPCFLSSVKVNIGHLEAAAGIASLIKVLLSLKYKYIPSNIHLNKVNKYIDLNNTPFKLVKEGVDWNPCDAEGNAIKRIAGISSFGFGGVNAHVILEEYKDEDYEEDKMQEYVIPVSAKKAENLKAYEENLANYLIEHKEIKLKDIAFTMNEGRDTFKYKDLIKVSTLDELINELKKLSLEEKTINDNEINIVSKIDGNRISLPTYPYSRDEYWFEDDIFSVDSKFVTDHVVGDTCIVPAALQIETFRKKITKDYNEKVNELRDIIFHQTIDKGVLNNIELVSNAYDTSYIYRNKESNALYSQLSFDKEIKPYTKESLNLKEIEKDLNNYKTGEECYNLFANYGFKYKKSFKVIKEIKYNNRLAISHLKLPLNCEDSFKEYVLHPSIIDGALQTVLVLLNDEIEYNDKKTNYFPYSIGEIEIYDSLVKECIVCAEKVNSNDIIKKYNLVITDTKGNVLVKINNYLIKIARIKTKDILYITEEEKDKKKVNIITKNDLSNTVIIRDLEKDYNTIKEEINAEINNGAYNFIYLLNNKNEVPIYITVFKYIKALSSIKRNINFVLIHSSNNKEDLNTVYNNAFVGLIKTLHIENPNITPTVIKVVSENINEEKLINIACTEIAYGLKEDNVIYYDDYRTGFELKENNLYSRNKEEAIASEDVVLIAGCGKLASLTAKHLINKYKAKVILAGRRDITDLKEEERELLSLGAEYYKVDITNYVQVEELLNNIKEIYKKVDGIINCAGIIKDSYLYNKTEENFKRVVDVKVKGTINLDKASKEFKLKYFILYSSVSCVFGNMGQGDYAYANRFLNNFAKYRNNLVKNEERFGKTLAIDFSYWQNGGMQVDDSVKDYMYDSWGVKALDNETGMEIIETAIKYDFTNVLPLYGDNEKIRNILLKQSTDEEKTLKKQENGDEMIMNTQKLQEVTEGYLKELLSKVTEIPVRKISITQSFNDYGVDSVTIMDLNIELEKTFDKIPKTLFFEYKNIKELTEYFIKNYRERINEVLINKFNEVENIKPVETIKAEYVKEPVLKTVSEPILNNKVEVKATSKYEEAEKRKTDIAIIGVSGIFPMADNIDDFWDNLMHGKDCIIEVPKERWDYKKYFNPEKGVRGKSYTKWGSFLNDIDKFDPLFFGISPLEAQMLDPQERLFLQNVWHTLEDAGYTKESLENDIVGVYVGVMWGQYQLYGAEPLEDGTVLVPASSYASIANRVSYMYNFTGPSIALDTMCSSSLTAIHLACNSIISGETDLAIAGGVNLTLHPNKHIFLSQTKFAASDGRCHSFGEGGDGYVPGEGVGSILLKPLSKAIEDNDNIYAVIKGTSINHGGKANGYTVPNIRQQSKVISRVYEKTNINPRTVNYIEAHGTGTALGDPIEVSSLCNVFDKFTEDKQYCSIGSVKSNVGHCESAAGIIGVIKVLLQMKYKMLVPSIHSETLNPNIYFENTPFYVQQKVEPWEKIKVIEDGLIKEYPRRAAINSFGAGGANAHILFEEYDNEDDFMSNENEPNIIVLSGRDKDRLRENVENLYNYLKKHTVGTSKSLSIDNEGSIKKEVAYILEKQTGINKNDIDYDALIVEYLATPVELVNFVENINSIYPDMQAININTLIDNASINEIVKFIADNREVSIIDSMQKEEAMKNLNITNIAYSLQVGREPMKERLAIIVESISKLIEKLEAYLNNETSDEVYTGTIEKSNLYMKDMLSGNEGRDFIKEVIANRKYEKIAILWISGINIYWNELYKGRKVKRISLPGYSFRKDTCWLPEILTKPRKIVVNEVKEEEKQYTYIHKWSEVKNPVINNKIHAGKILVVYKNDSEITILKDMLVAKKDLNDILLYKINNKDEINVDSIKHVTQIYYLTFSNNMVSIENSFEEIQESTVGFLFKFIKYLQTNEVLTNDLRLTIVVNNLKFNLYNNKSNAFVAALNGFMKSFAREFKMVETLFVSLEQDELNNKEAWSKVLELAGGKGSLNTYVLNQNKVEKLTFDEFKLINNDKKKLKNKGVYVVLGGSGNVGRKLSEYLAENYKAKVIIAGRSKTDEKLSLLKETIIKYGGEYTYISADLTNEEAVRNLFNEIVNKYNKIDGIFDLVMSLQYSSIKDMNEEIFYSDIASKVKGTYILDKILTEFNVKISLDFLVIFSSGEAFTGDAGWSTYALGCCFEDSYADYMREVHNIKTIVINWGYFDKENDPYIEKLKKSGIHPLSKELSMNILEKVLVSDVNNVLALDVEENVLRLMGVKEETESVIDVKKITERVKSETELTIEEVKDYVKAVLSRCLNILAERFEDNVDLTEYGVDSLIVTDIHKEFEKDLGKLVVTMLTENSTIERLAKYLKSNKADELNKLFNIVVEKEEKDSFKIIDVVNEEDVYEYLLDYHNGYKDGTFKNKISVQKQTLNYQKSRSKLVHMLVKTQYDNELEVFTIGKGEPLLLIPAIGLTAPTWINQVTEFKDRYQIIIIHNPGYGLSSIGEKLNADILISSFEHVLNEMNIEKVNIVASCFGGIAGQQFAAKYPEKVKSLILCGAFYKNFGLPNISIESIPIDKMSEATQMVARGINSDFDKIIESNESQKSVYNMSRKILMNSQCVNPLVVMRYISQILVVNTSEILKIISVPTLCIAGTLDTIVDINSSQYIADNVKCGKYKEIEGAGHYPYLTHPAVFNEMLNDFLSEIK